MSFLRLSVQSPKRVDAALRQILSHLDLEEHGWILAQDHHHGFSEAQFHTAWLSPGGSLHDITPRAGELEVLFVPDHRRRIEFSQHEGKPAILSYDNVRLRNNEWLTPLAKIKVVMESDFVHRYGLWPWGTNPDA